MHYKYTTHLRALLLCTFCVLGLHAQTWQDTLAMQYDILQPYVNTGYLYNRFYLAPFVDSGYTANPANYNGATNAEACNYNTFYKLAEDFRAAAYDSTLLPSYYNLKDIDFAQRNLADVPIAVLQLDYQKIYPFAADSGWITFDTVANRYLPIPDSTHFTDTVYDGNGQIVTILDTTIYNNPDSIMKLALPTNHLFAASTFSNAFGIPALGTAVTFRLPSSLFFSNTTVNTSYQIDLDDGVGWRNVTPNQLVSVTYGSFGRKEIRIKFNITGWNNGELPIAKTYLVLFKTAPPPDDAFDVSALVVNAPCPNLSDGGFGTGEARLSVRYADPTRKQLTRPFILVEGFDSYLRKTNSDFNKYDPNTGGYGRLAWGGFMSGIFMNDVGDTVYKQLRQAPLLFDSLNTLGYDVLLLDFKGSLNGIEQNANALIKVVLWVNQEKTSDEELVVVGGSMGGLIARYALRKMELEDCCHQTRMYGTFDTPHDGANIPLGMQEWVYNAWKNFMSSEAERTYKDVLSSKSACQLMRYHRELSKEAEHLALQAVLDSMGHPQDCYRVAISNGTATGLGLAINPGDELLHYEFFVEAPVAVSAPIPLINITATNQLMLLQNNAFAVSNSPNSISNQLLLETKPLGNTVLNYGLIQGIAAAAKYTLTGIATGKLLSDFVSPPGTPFHFLTYSAVQAVVSTAYSASLLYIHNQNNNVLAQNIYANRPTAPYDYCPGSTTPTMAEVAGDQKIKLGQIFNEEINLGLGTITALHKSHTFVPTISSLDLSDTTDLFCNVEAQITNNPSISPFHSVFYPEHDPFRHEEHVEITLGNRVFAISQIEANRPVLHDAGTTLSKTLPNTFNWGNPARVIIHNVTVQNGGKMYVNRYMPLDYGNGPLPGLLSRFEMQTSYCGAYIIIEDGGLFELGQNNYINVGQGIDNNKANVNFRKNSVLEVQQGGTLRINDNSTLVIEPGAELIIHPGAVIDLAGPNAVLELQGKVTLLPGASLNPTGTGIVRFAQAMQSPADAATFWQTSSNNEVKLLGTNGQKRAEIVENLYLPAKLDSVVFSGVTATLALNVSLHISTPPVRFSNSNFIGADTTQQHNGVHLAGQKALVGKSSFKHGVVGLKNVLPGGQVAFSIRNCTFTHNTTGYMQHGGQLLAEQCTARYNTTGLLIEAATNSISINGGIFSHNTQNGIHVINAQANTTLYANEAAINNNGNAGIAANCHVRPTCCNITGNLYGIAHNGASSVLLHDGAQNQLTNNTWAVVVQGSIGIHLENGQNNFSGSANYVNGELPQLNANPSIDVLENFMPGTGSGNVVTLPIDVKWRDVQNNLYPIPVTNWSPTVTLPSNCAPLPGGANPGNDLAGDIMMGYISTKVVNTSYYTNVWLHQALADAARKVSNPEGVYNDLLAIARFNEILSNINGPLTDAEMQATRFAAELMIAALNNAYEQGLVPQNGGTEGNPEHPYLQLVTGQINNLMANAGLSAEEHFNLTLALAQTYRMAEHFDYALGVLDSAANPVTAEELLHTEYWQCVCQAEEQLVQEAITPDQFSIELENCRGLLAQFNKWQQVLVPGYTEVSNTNGQANLFAPLYPNPAGNGTLVQLVQPGIPAQVTLLDVTGKTLQVEEIPGTSQSHLLDLQHYADGVYLVKVTQGNQTQTQRLVVRN